MLLRQIDALTPAEFINGLLPPEVRRVDPRAWATLPGKARTFEALGIQTVEPRQDAGGLLIGGVNSSETIRGLETINGLSVNTLEDLMRPGRGDPRQSVSGYLGDRDELLQIMAKDNDAVSANGMTHQQIAASMSYFIEMSNRNPHHVGSAGDPPVILLNGLAFEVEYRQWGDFQQSPFNDGSRSIRDYFVTRIDTGDTITVSPLLRDMVERYGFYEGDTRYRVDPDTWIRFLGLGGNQVTGLDAP